MHRSHRDSISTALIKQGMFLPQNIHTKLFDSPPEDMCVYTCLCVCGCECFDTNAGWWVGAILRRTLHVAVKEETFEMIFNNTVYQKYTIFSPDHFSN